MQCIDRQNRICRLCDLNRVEDELHFGFECPAYRIEREDMIDKLRFGNQGFVVNNIQPENLYKICMMRPFILAKYLKKIWDKRTSILISNSG